MNIQPNLRMSKAAFIEWNAAAEERCELVRGRVVMMPGASRAHARIVGRLVRALMNRLDPKHWEVVAEFGLDAGPETLRYPDIVVDRAGGADKDYTATTPVFIAEVLSPTTAEIDLGDKAAEYLQLESLAAYVVFSQDEPKAWVWNRGASRFDAAPLVLAGGDAMLRIAALQLEIPLAELYPSQAS
jgi:Uma2 family endonuclease